jgi:hypothetical protein
MFCLSRSRFNASIPGALPTRPLAFFQVLLPADFQAIQVEQPAERPTAHSFYKHSPDPHNLDTISPNPIIVTNAGRTNRCQVELLLVSWLMAKMHHP